MKHWIEQEMIEMTEGRIWLADEDMKAGGILFEYVTREEAETFVRRLRKHGITCVEIVSCDNVVEDENIPKEKEPKPSPATMDSVTLAFREGAQGYIVTGCGTGARMVIPAENAGRSVTGIDGNAFSNNSEITEVYLPDSVATIGSCAFFGCKNLSRIVIGKGIRGIKASTFANCLSLGKVYYHGDEQGWKNIVIESGNSKLIASNLYFYSEQSVQGGKYWHYVNGEIVEWE